MSETSTRRPLSPVAGWLVARVTRALRFDPRQLPELETWGDAMTDALLATPIPTNCAIVDTPDGRLVVNVFTRQVVARAPSDLVIPEIDTSPIDPVGVAVVKARAEALGFRAEFDGR